MIGWPNGLKKVYQARRSFAGPDEARRILVDIAKLLELCAILRRIKPGSTANPQCNISK